MDITESFAFTGIWFNVMAGWLAIFNQSAATIYHLQKRKMVVGYKKGKGAGHVPCVFFADIVGWPRDALSWSL